VQHGCGMVMGTYQGRFGDMPPGARPLAYTSIHILRLEGGRIVEDWNLWDSLGWWQQLDILPDNDQISSMAVRNPHP
jgi:predicted ester cyclase